MPLVDRKVTLLKKLKNPFYLDKFLNMHEFYE